MQVETGRPASVPVFHFRTSGPVLLYSLALVPHGVEAVSYTHLDVYKRQVL